MSCDYDIDDNEFIRELLETHVKMKYNTKNSKITVSTMQLQIYSRCCNDSGYRDAKESYYIIGIEVKVDDKENESNPNYTANIINIDKEKLDIIYNDILNSVPDCKLSYVIGIN